MTDRRFFAATDRVALAGVDAPNRTIVDAKPKMILAPYVDLCRSPEGGRDKQMLFGDAFDLIDEQDGAAFGRDPVDGYVGWIDARALAPRLTATHQIATTSSHIYAEADMKSHDLMPLPFGAQLHSEGEGDGFIGLATGGFVPKQHTAPLSLPEDDPALIAEAFLGCPYLWGGNTTWGIDCSGLVRTALTFCNMTCPRDSDLQAKAFAPVEAKDLQRGDLVHWAGHVGMMLDAETLIHANAHHMAVAVEPLHQAATRISTKEFGDITGFSRPHL